MTKIEDFLKYFKLQGQGHQVKNVGTNGNVSSQEMYISKTKALPLPVRKLLLMLTFF